MRSFFDLFNPESAEAVRRILLKSHTPSSPTEAQIVGLCKAYEGLIHPQPPQKRKTPHESLKSLMEHSGETFNGVVVKALWETLTLFPPGSFVKLSTGEIAQVTELHPSQPMRPAVEILVSASGELLKPSRRIDLATATEPFIERAADAADGEVP